MTFDKNSLNKYDLSQICHLGALPVSNKIAVQEAIKLRSVIQGHLALSYKEALVIRRIFSLVDMITKAKFSNSPNDFKIRLFG